MYKQVYWSSSARRSLKLAHQNKGKNCIGQEQLPKNDSPLPAPPESENESLVPVVAEPENETPAFKAVKEEITTAVRGLKAITNYLEEECVRFLQVIDEISSDHLSIRDKIGDLLADLEYHEVVLQIFKQFNRLEVIETENIKTWVLLYYTTMISTNYTDSSEKFSMCLEKSEAVEQLTELFKHTEYDDDLENNGLKYGVFTNILITLHNIVRFTGIKFHYKEAKTAEKVMPLIGVKNEFICSVAMLLLAYIIDEDENDKIVDENNIIICIVTWLSQSLNHPSRRARGFTPWELTRGLSKLAVNDSNKKKIIEANALQEFSKMLSFNDARELENTTECLWTLCFDKSARQVIKDFPDIVAALDSLKNSDNEKIRKNAKGALWLINEEKEYSKVTDNVGEDVGQHIFISYSWAEKTKVKEIYKSLQSHGFKVWVDWENMGGSTLQAMAEAVENASVVLICVSENYKLSNNCRLEAEYTFTKKRNYLPLVMQKQYKADGWLGIMLGSKLYYDFSGKYPYEQSEQQLLKALRELEITRPTLEPMSASQESHSTESCYKMTNAEVVEWLEKKGLQRLSSLLYNIDGKMLWDMKLFSETAPEYFFKEIKDQFELSLVEVIQFNSALKTLH